MDLMAMVRNAYDGTSDIPECQAAKYGIDIHRHAAASWCACRTTSRDPPVMGGGCNRSDICHVLPTRLSTEFIRDARIRKT